MTQDLIKTSEDKREFRDCIKQLSEGLFKTGDIQNTIKNKIPLKYVEFFASLIKHRLDRTDIENALVKLDSHLNRLKEVNLVIAFEPTQENIDNIYNWIKKNLGENKIINLEVKKEIIGGAIITYEGFYEDLSLKNSIETGFLQNKVYIKKVIK